MAVIDDTFLESVFGAAGDSFAVPAHGAADILQRALHGEEVPDDDSTSPDADDPVVPASRRWGQVVRTHRVLSVAAAIVLVGAVTGTALSFTSTSGTDNRTVGGLQADGTVAQSGVAKSALPESGFAGSTPTTTTPLPSFATAPQAAAGSNAAGATTGGSATNAAPLEAPAASGTGTTATPANGALPGSVGQSARVEQTGSLSLTVAKGTLSTTMAKLSYLATAANGFVANSQTQSGASSDGTPSGTITLQVPVSSFSTVLKEAQSLGHTSALTTKATDVTGQYVDLQARITALQDSRQQYLTIMAKATSIGDVLAVQAQLDSLQEQIEQLQGQLQVLSSETAYSTLNITVSEKAPRGHHTPPPRPRSSLQKAWHASIHGFTDGVDGLIRLAGPFLFGLLCLAVVVLGGRVLWRRYQRHNL